MKLAEIILALIALVLVRYYSLNFGGDLTSGSFQDRYNVGLITIGGFILITLPLLISYIWSPAGTYQPFLEIIYNVTGFILFMVVGGLALSHYINYSGWNDHTNMGHYYQHAAEHRGSSGDHMVRGDVTPSWDAKHVDQYGNPQVDAYGNPQVDQYGNPHGDNKYYDYGSGINRFLGMNTTDHTAAGKAVGAICIINGIFYLIDAAMAFRQGSTV
jgi:hypothetical protein